MRDVTNSVSGSLWGPRAAGLVWQLLVESLVLASAGAALGLAVAVWGSRMLLTQLIFQGSGVFLDLSLNRTVIGFTTVVSTFVALLFGTLPAMRATDLHPGSVLAEPARTGGGQVPRRRFGMLMALQVALCLILVIGAGMFLRSFVAMARLDPWVRHARGARRQRDCGRRARRPVA